MSIDVLAIIPARGGSKGIPKKNLQPLAGKPLVAHSILQAQQTPSITRVVVSTDDEEIAAITQAYGAEIVWRPESLSGDAATSESALIHTLKHLQESEDYQPDILVFLQCTSPLTLAEDIEGTIQALLQGQADSALSVAPFHYFLWGYGREGDVIAINHDKYIRPRRQDRDPQYVETGAVYVMRVPGFLQARHRFFGKIAIYHMPLERRLEIDDPVDLQIAEVLMAHQQNPIET
jgi:CMP-N-acetylneuraminic acid synthetase